MSRRAPVDGYDFGNKRQYRRNVWAEAKRWANHSVAHRHALLMPSSEGDEVEVAKAAGFREENLFLVDENPAIAAHLKRRFRRATCLGVPVERAATRLAQRGQKIDVANLDLCSPADAASRVAHEFANSGVLSDDALVFVTYLKGRERLFPGMRAMVGSFERAAAIIGIGRPAIDSTFRGLDPIRATVLMLAIASGKRLSDGPARFARPLRGGEYRSTAGTQVMGWLAYSVRGGPAISETLGRGYAVTKEQIDDLRRG